MGRGGQRGGGRRLVRVVESHNRYEAGECVIKLTLEQSHNNQKGAVQESGRSLRRLLLQFRQEEKKV